MTPKEFAEKWFKTIDAKNYDGLKNLMADNHQFRNPATPDALNRDNHIGMIQGMMSAFEGGHHIEQLISEGDWVVIRGRWKGKHTGEFNGIPATGNPVDFTFVDTMHVVNGKLSEEFMEWSMMTLLTQVGAMPQPA
jgi:predicted ester cyclase